MPVYELPAAPLFPRPELADPSGLLAVGGDLSPARLLEAYRLGIFPWYSEGDPILWWSPDPRLILELDALHVSRSLRKALRRGEFTFSCDEAFVDVIDACAVTRLEDGEETWITPAMEVAYIHLHELGFAHSVEVWQDGELVGGLYGVSIGQAFCGESMFSRVSDASKAAMVALVEILRAQGATLLDCQLPTDHLKSLGATELSRADFLKRLRVATRAPSRRGPWVWPQGAASTGAGPTDGAL